LERAPGFPVKVWGADTYGARHRRIL